MRALLVIFSIAGLLVACSNDGALEGSGSSDVSTDGVDPQGADGETDGDGPGDGGPATAECIVA